MATEARPPRIPFQVRRMMFSAPRTEGHLQRMDHEAGGMGGDAGGGGRNPLRSGDVAQEPYSQPGMWFNDIVNQNKVERNQARMDQATDAQQQKVSAGVDAYMQAYTQTGDARQALMQVFHPDSGGHVHFSDPATFQGIMKMAGAMQTAGAGQGQFQSVDLGHGLTGVIDPSGKASVHNARDFVTPEAQARMSNDAAKTEQGAERLNIQARQENLNERKFAQPQEKPAKALTIGEERAMEGQGQAMDALLKMQQNSGASGSFGYGALERGVAQYTKLSPEEASAFNQGYNELRQAMAQLPGSSRTKAMFEAKMATLPSPNNAQAWNDGQAIPGMINLIRGQIASEYMTFAQEGKSTAEIADMAKRYDADPNYMSMLHGALTKLQQSPASLSGPEVQALQYEMGRNTLTSDQQMRTIRQAYQRGLVPQKDYAKLAETNPSLNQISPQERIQPGAVDADGQPMLRPPPDVLKAQQAQAAAAAMAPQAQPQGAQQQPAATTPAQNAPGASLVPGGAFSAPPSSQPMEAASPTPAASGGAQPQPPAQSAPAQPAQQEGHPNIGGRAGPGDESDANPQPPAQAPSSGQAEAQAPQQIEQQQSEQAPGTTGIFGSLMNQIGTAIQNHIPAFLQSQQGAQD